MSNEVVAMASAAGGRCSSCFRPLKTALSLIITGGLAFTSSVAGLARSEFTVVTPSGVAQAGMIPAGVVAEGALILAHEPEASAGVVAEFDLAAIPHPVTPVARLGLGLVTKVKVSRPGAPAGGERAALHAFLAGTAGAPPQLVGSQPVKPAGIPTAYTLDVTRAINPALQRPGGTGRTIRIEVRITGKPLPYEVYALNPGDVRLEIASPAGWIDDWQERLVPLTHGRSVYREASLPLTEERGAEVILPLLFPARRITEVIHNAAGEPLQEGRDWRLHDGKLVLPVGTRAPVQFAPEFFTVMQKATDGTERPVRTSIRIMEGAWYHERQIEVSYEPSVRDVSLPPPRSTPEDLPRTQRLLTAGNPVTLMLFGDSISAGANASKVSGVWPYQPDYGELVVRRLEQHYRTKITYLNHSRGGGTSGHAATQADAQVAWFKPDLVLLAFGMNERTPERRVAHRANLEQIIDVVRARSPDTEFIIITPMLNSPSQPTGLEPVQFIRDEARKVARPGIAFVDLTTTHLELLRRKHYLDLSGNGVNHPNDFLMRIYAQRVLEVLLPAAR